MPEALAGLELVVCDLAHQLWTDRPPPEVLSPRPAAEPARHPAGAVRIPLALRNVDLQRLQFGDQLFALGGTERRGVPDVLKGAFAVIQTEQQRAERLAVGRLTPADDHAIGRALMLDLHPQALAGHVGACPGLRHHAIESSALEAFEPLSRRRAVTRVGSKKDRRLGVLE